MTTLLETRHSEGFIVYMKRELSVDQGTLISGQKVAAGTVLGTVLGTTAAAAALRTNTGNGTFGAINVLPPAIEGEYTLSMVSATTFVVTDPNGERLPQGSTGVAYAQAGLSFTLTAGGTAFVEGDEFSIIVSATGAGYAAYDPTGNDGREIATAIALNDTDATAAAHNIAVLARDAAVNASELVWGANVTTAAQQNAAMAQLQGEPHIVARTGEGIATYP